MTESASGPSAAGVGDPLGGMLVAAFGGPTGSIIRGTQTDGSGAYSLSNLTAGDWRLIVVDPAGAHPVEWWENGTVGAPPR